MIQLEMEEGRCSPGGGKSAFFCTGTYYGSMRDSGAYALLAQANELASRGVHEASMQAQISIPADMDRSRINAIRNHMKAAARSLSEKGFSVKELAVQGGIQTALKVPSVRVIAAGCAEGEFSMQSLGADCIGQAGQEILQVGYAGLEGMLRIAGEREAELRERFAPAFIRQIKSFGEEVCGLEKIAAARRQGILCIRQITEGGILAALWRLSEECGRGMSLDMRKIAIRQETIEVCEHFRLNPYQLTSGGSFLMLAERGEAEAEAEAMRGEGIPAAVLGRLSENNDKVLRNGEDIRYLDRPAPDELMKIF